MHKSTRFFLFVGIAFFQQIATAAPALEWSVSAGMNHYKEPEMQLHGPELGLHVKTDRMGDGIGLYGEADVLLGKQHYSSDRTGQMDGVSNIETRWRGLTRVLPGDGDQAGLYMGLGLHTLWNDLRGTSTTDDVGYVRQAMQLWLPLRWVSGEAWQLETGVLLKGRHTTKLEQNVNNNQKTGHYMQASWDYSLNPQNTLTPYVRYTHLADSDVVVMGGHGWIEPNNQRWQLGLKWRWDKR
jgi:hypothetical protein